MCEDSDYVRTDRSSVSPRGGGRGRARGGRGGGGDGQDTGVTPTPIRGDTTPCMVLAALIIIIMTMIKGSPPYS